MHSARPSTVVDHFWIVANGPRGIPRTGEPGGKWMIFVHRSEVDDLWDRVAAAVRNQTLGGVAKVSTARPNPHSGDPKKHVICVYTANADDEVEIHRVRDELRELGISWRINYKTNAVTRQGVYANRGDRRISKFSD